MVVVLPVCMSDRKLLDQNLDWMLWLHGRLNAEAIVLTSNRDLGKSFAQRAANVFFDIQLHLCKHPDQGWPMGPNYAFLDAIGLMQRLGAYWLWMEPDMVPVKRDWYDQLEIGYLKSGKPCFGPVIGGPGGHMNGTGVYMPDMSPFVPMIKARIKEPFDLVLRESLRSHVADGSHLIQHCGTIRDGCCSTDVGGPPSFPNTDSLNVINWSTVLFHPNKDGTLIKRLKEAMIRADSKP